MKPRTSIIDPQRSTRATIRQELENALRTDAEFDAFCLDYFPDTYRLFALGMDRQQKLNLLLSREDLVHLKARLATTGKVDAAIHAMPEHRRHKGNSPATSLRNYLPGALASAILVLIGGILLSVIRSPAWELLSTRSEEADSQKLLRSIPSGAEIWDMRTGRRLGMTPWPIETSLLPRSICLRHPGMGDMVLFFSEGKLPRAAVVLHPVGSSTPEVCDVPIPILQ